jgi:hypothetical protein
MGLYNRQPDAHNMVRILGRGGGSSLSPSMDHVTSHSYHLTHLHERGLEDPVVDVIHQIPALLNQ